MYQLPLDNGQSKDEKIRKALQTFVSQRSVANRAIDWLREKLLITGDLIWDAVGIDIGTQLVMPANDFIKAFASKDRKRLLQLNKKLRQLRAKSSLDFRYHDYGHGYFYQSFERLLISGRRRTHARVRELGLERICHDRRVLDLGANVCFLTLELSEVAREIHAVDSNPHAMEIGRTAGSYLTTNNYTLHVSDYLEFLHRCEGGAFEVILLLSSHVSFDHTDASQVNELLQECRRVLAVGGKLIFESHPRFFEDRYIGLERTLSLISQSFTVTSLGQAVYGSMLDHGRLVAYCTKD